MALTLQNLLVKACYNLGVLSYGTATGGTTTTVVDSSKSSANDESAEVDVWKNGTMFITYDAAGGSAAPEGEMGAISAFASSTGTFTVPTMTAAVAAGDRYSFTSELYPLLELIKAANDGLQDLGDLDGMYTTLSFANGTLYYSLPAAIKEVHKVELLSPSNVYNEVYNWKYTESLPGIASQLEFNHNLPYEDTLRVHYRGRHPTLTAYNSVVSEFVDDELAMLATVNKAMEWQVSRSQGSQDFDKQKWNDIKMQLAQKKLEIKPQQKYRRKFLFTFDHASFR
jgi:hypothetical protein